MTPPRRYTFGRDQKLKRPGDFEHVLAGKISKTRGPLKLTAAAGVTRKSRLGIRIGRSCGSAPVRNLIKRRLREAFRHLQHDLPLPLDVVASVRPHPPLELAEYQRLLSHLLIRLTQQVHEHATVTQSPPADPEHGSGAQ